MNYIDAVIIVILLIYMADGYRRGFIKVSFELVDFIISVILALKFYPNIAKALALFLPVAGFWQNLIAFVLVWLLSEILFAWLFSIVQALIPSFIKGSLPNKIAGIFVAGLMGLLGISILLTLFFASPGLPQVKNDISASFLGNKIVLKGAKVFSSFENRLGGNVQQNFLYLTTIPKDGQIKLNVKPTSNSVDEQAEQKMFLLVNSERQKVGLQPLTFSTNLQKVARAHALDMWQRKYFAHVNPDGVDPLHRVLNAGISFQVVGENLALAPNVNLAHIGLMNSPQHKDNILDRDFGKVGIGVIDGGTYGEMFVQDFSN